MDPISITLTMAGWLVTPLMTELLKLIDLRGNPKLQLLKLYLDDIDAKRAQVVHGQSDVPNPEHWLRRVKYTVYDAEDAIHSDDERQIDVILERFKLLTNEISHPVSPQTSSGNHNLIQIPAWRITTYLVSREINGRTDEIDKLKKWVCDQSSDSNKNFSLLSIIGTGGVGKTLLSQLIFNNPEVRENFEVMVWVLLYEPRMPIIAIKPNEPTSPNDPTSFYGHPIAFSPHHFEDFHNKFISKISCKMFFMVLDDVWNVAHHDWETYCSLFNCGKEGSKIIVTTQLEKTVNRIEPNLEINLDVLRQNEYWELFKKCAFGSPGHHSDLEDVGRNISTRFGCSPLAAVEVGRELKCSLNQERWNLISHNKFCIVDRKDGDIISILGLCYKQLPERLKQCYVSCALFPRNYPFEKQELNLIWIGLGFLHFESRTTNYVDDFSKRSFLVNATRTNGRYVFQHVLHELAEYISDGEFLRLEEEIKGGENIEIPMHTRHLYINANNFVEASKALGKNRKLRSLVIVGGLSNPHHEKIFLKSLKKVLEKLEFLRFLVLPLPPTNLSETVGALKYLRYLQFPNNQQKLPRLSNSILGKYKLKLWNGCKYLLVGNDIDKLIKLYCSSSNIVDVTI